MADKARRATKEILISMTNIINVMKEAEENLASNNLTALCGDLRKVEQISGDLRREIEIKYGVTRP